MKKTRVLLVAVAIAGVMAVGNTANTSAASQGTDGTEIQVMEPEQLEIQLGEEWAGREFQLKTDVGLYPGTITVGEDGVLRTELGGSKSYILTCLSSGNTATDSEQALATEASEVVDQEDEMQAESGENASGEINEESPESSPAETSSGAAVQENNSNKEVAGIPIKHLFLFSVGMIAAISALIVMHIVQKRKDQEEYDEDDYDEDE